MDTTGNTLPGDDFVVLGSGYEAGFDAGYAKGFTDGLDESAGDPRVDRIEAGFKAMYAATNGEYSREDMIVLDALQAGRDFVIRLVRRELHIEQLVAELKARERIIEVYERQLAKDDPAPARRPAP